MALYKAVRDGFIGNVWRKKGEDVEMSERAAKYLVEPLGDNLVLAAGEAAGTEAEKSAKRPRRNAEADE